MRPQRILFIAHSAQRGGAEYCLDTTLRYLDRERFEPLVVIPHEGPMADSARAMGIEVVVLSMCHWLYFDKNLWYWKNLVGRALPNVSRLTQLIREREIDLVYTNTSAIFEPALAARRAGVPHLWHIHEVLQVGNAMSQLLPIRWIQRFIRRYSSLVVFESHAARQVFEEATPMPDAEVVHNSLRLVPEDSPAAGIDLRQSLGISESDVVVGFAGQLIDRKNPLLLVSALSMLTSRENVVCLFAGDGPLNTKLQEAIERLELETVCRLLPFQTDIEPFLHAIDVLALPSRQESFGLVLLEAAACGKPVVACKSQGPAEIVVDGETGWLVDQNDPADFASKLERLIESAIQRQQMGTAARTHVLENFHPESNTRRLETMIANLTSPSAFRLIEQTL